MSATVEKLEGLEYKLTIPLSEQEAELKVSERLAEMSKRVRIDGFRPGKVPVNVIEQRYGKAVRDEVLEELLKNELHQALLENKLEPTATPKIAPVEGARYTFDARFEVYPAITLKPYQDLTIKKLTAEVSEQDVETALTRLQQQNQDWQTVDRAVQDGDKVVINFSGRIDGEKFEGGAAEKFDLIIGSDSMIPGFESAIIGAKVDQTFDITVRFPDDYHKVELAGQEAVFEIYLHSVAEGQLPKLDDAFADKVGVSEGIAELRQRMQQMLQDNLAQVTKNKLKQAVLDTLIAEHTIDLPKSLLDAEKLRLQVQALQAHDSKNLHDIKEITGSDIYANEAERRVLYGLLLTQVVKDHNIEATDQQIAEKIQQIAVGYDQPEEVVSWYYGNDERMNEVKHLLVEEIAIETVLEQAQIDEEIISYAELVK